MTAIVGILNREAVAVAADSAVTTGDGKVFNNADKIFTLSGGQPVGFAVYANARFYGTPWSTIFKMYAAELGSRTFDTLQEYTDDFFRFLDSFKNEYVSREEQDRLLVRDIRNFWHEQVVMPSVEDGFLDESKALRKRLTHILKKCSTIDKFQQVSDYKIRDFRKLIEFDFLIPLLFERAPAEGENPTRMASQITKTFYEVFTRKVSESKTTTSIVFFGYGNKEIYPSIFVKNVMSCVNGKLIVSDVTEKHISNECVSAIIPMAQDDVMTTFLDGISPEMRSAILHYVAEMIKSTMASFRKALRKDPDKEKKLAKVDLDGILNKFASDINDFELKKINAPVLSVAASLTCQDMAELAESFIKMTTLNRHINPTVESVGGPVKVALVTKGGFTWYNGDKMIA